MSNIKDIIKIPLIPQIPNEIIEAVNRNNLVVFSGAGVSRLQSIGCLGWDQLAKNLLERCYKEKKINFKEKEYLLNISDHRKIITIAYKLFKKIEFPFWDEMRIALKEGEKYKRLIKVPNVYNDIYQLRGINITTNADNHFDRLFTENNIIFKEYQFDPMNIERTKIYHLHGSIKEPSTLVFTLSKYFNLYQKVKISAFLTKVFSEYTVLFIGYGLGEFELLEYLFLHNNADKSQLQSQKFILIPYYRGEGNLVKMDQSYFEDMRITVIPFAKDDNGYNQLSDIIQNWREEINARSKYNFESTKVIDDALANPTDEKIEQIIQLTKHESYQEEYLFHNFEKGSNIDLWFNHLDKYGYLNPNKIPMPYKNEKGYVNQKQWLTLYYLNILSKNIDSIEKKGIKPAFFKKINEIINYEIDVIDNKYFSPSHLMIDIINGLPANILTKQHIKYFQFAIKRNSFTVCNDIYKIFLPKLIKHNLKNLLIHLLGVLLEYKRMEDRFLETNLKEYHSVFDKYYLPRILKEFTQNIYSVCDNECYKIVLKKLNSIIKSDENAFNMIRIRTIEDHPQSHFTDRYEYQLIHFIRDILLLCKKEDLEPIIRYLFWRKHSIYKRLALNTIRVRYNELKQLFWEWVKKVKNPLDDINVKHELWAMANENSAMFTENEIDTFIQWIETKDFSFYQKGDYDSKEIEAFIAYRKKELLLALKGSENAKVENMLKKYSEISPEDVDHPGFDIWMGGMVLKKTNTTPEDLLKKSNEEIVEFLNEFTGPERYPREGDSVYDLHNSLEFCVRDNPARFVDNLEPFKTVDLAYVSSIIGGLRDAWRSKKGFNWENVFNYIEEIISTSNFWEYKPIEDSFNYQRWTIEAIADLIGVGTQSDDNAFDTKLLGRTEQILFMLSEKTVSDYKPLNDVITDVMNSIKGRIYTALMQLSLRYAKVYKKSDDHRWKESIKNHFEDRLFNKPEKTPEIWVTVGEFFINLVYLDREWVYKHINHLFPKGKESNWKNVFTAYLFYSSTIYKDLYQLMKDNGHYEKAIYTSFDSVSLNEDIRVALMSHVGVGYLEGFEKIEDESSLINLVLKYKDPVQIKELIQYFWRPRNKIKPEKIKLVKILWRVLFKALKEEESNKDFQEAIAYLSLFVSLFKEIDDEMLKWVQFSSIYTNKHHILYSFVEYLKPLSKTNPENVGLIYLNLLKRDIVPTYEEEDIRETVVSIFEAGFKDLGNKICNGYIEQGNLMLRDIFEEHNS